MFRLVRWVAAPEAKSAVSDCILLSFALSRAVQQQQWACVCDVAGKDHGISDAY